nr:hypothetical protein [Synergistaceae bacterium]
MKHERAEIKELREQVGLTQYQAGAMIVLDLNLYGKLEDEAHSVKSFKNLRGYTRDYLMRF